MNSALRPIFDSQATLARRPSRVGSAIFIAILSCTIFACRNRSGPVIEFTRVPRANDSGSDRTDTIAGRVIRARPGQHIVLFARWGPWWVQPLVDQPFTTIEQDSKWRNSTHFGTQYAALLVDPNYQPPATIGSLPPIGHGVVAVAVVKGRPEF